MTQGTRKQFDAATIERIVRAVLAEVLGSGKSRTAQTQSGKENKVASGRELVLTSSVVSMALVEGRLSDITTLVVPRGAIITPAVRDELRRYKVSVASAVQAAQKKVVRALLVGVDQIGLQANSLLGDLANEGWQLERLQETELTEIVTTLARKVSDGNRALLLTRQTAAALCLANRHRAVRAAWGTNAEVVGEAMAAIDPNLLVIDPRGKTAYEVRRMVEAWHRGLTGMATYRQQLSRASEIN